MLKKDSTSNIVQIKMHYDLRRQKVSKRIRQKLQLQVQHQFINFLGREFLTPSVWDPTLGCSLQNLKS